MVEESLMTDNGRAQMGGQRKRHSWERQEG